MRTTNWTVYRVVTLGLMLGFTSVSLAQQQIPMLKVGNPCAMNNPCAAKNPCAMNQPCNPCTGKNPCAAKSSGNPCATAARIDPDKVKRPAAAPRYTGMKRRELVELGATLFKDTSLSTNGLSCNDCHATNDLFNASFTENYPHPVSMAKQRAGVRVVDADEFVQFCMMAPMESQPLPWDSKELAALTAYVLDVKQPNFIKMVQANPCFLKNKATNPCATPSMGNPCRGQNPCASRGN